MLVLYLFGLCAKIHGTPAVVHNEGILCIRCMGAGSYTIKWVALSIIVTQYDVCHKQTHVSSVLL